MAAGGLERTWEAAREADDWLERNGYGPGAEVLRVEILARSLAPAPPGRPCVVLRALGAVLTLAVVALAVVLLR